MVSKNAALPATMAIDEHAGCVGKSIPEPTWPSPFYAKME